MVEIGLHGDLAPDYVQGIPYATYIAIQARLHTLFGKQLMRPNYGSLVYREVYRDNVTHLRNAVAHALVGLPNLDGIDVEIEQTARTFTIIVNGIAFTPIIVETIRAFDDGFDDGFA